MNQDTREIQHVLEQCMTARQIIDQLQNLDDLDARVLFVCDYGDYHRTQQALPVTEIVEATSQSLRTTAYSQSGVCEIPEADLRESDEDYEPDLDEYEDEEVEVFPIAFLR